MIVAVAVSISTSLVLYFLVTVVDIKLIFKSLISKYIKMKINYDKNKSSFWLRQKLLLS
jgi:hypothetical protein